jgi:hypothetical protein
MPIKKKGESEQSWMERCVPLVMAENKQITRDQAVAQCLSMYKDNPDTIMRDTGKRIGFDKTSLNEKIKTDNDDMLTIGAIIASEIVQQYDDGYAYKPADELKKMAETAQLVGSVPVKILSHPGADTNYLLLKHSDVNGKVDNFEFVKNLPDPKTGRPMRRGVKADITWFKNRTPQDTINKMVDGELRDVSIGFTFDKDIKKGKWQGTDYDYIQRNIFLNHLAAPIPKGRCPGPICGIGFDANLKFGMDELTMSKCPVCKTIASVGLLEASKNLYINYGPEVLQVIRGAIITPLKPKQTTVTDSSNDLTKQFNEVYGKLSSRLQK